MTTRWISCSLLAASVLILAGARAAQSEKDYMAYLYDPDAPRVSFEVCLPKRTEFFDPISVDITNWPVDIDLPKVREQFDAAEKSRAADTSPPKSADRIYQTIREWRAPKGSTDEPETPYLVGGSIKSDDSGMSDERVPIHLSDTTEKDEPVFYYFTGERPKDIVAIHVSLPDVRGASEHPRIFWFRLPKNIIGGAYTDWVPPISEETRNEGPSFSMQVTHGKELPLVDVEKNAPRMRFKLMSIKDDSALTRTYLRARYAAQRERVKAGRPSLSRQGVLFVADRGAAIPACGE